MFTVWKKLIGTGATILLITLSPGCRSHPLRGYQQGCCDQTAPASNYSPPTVDLSLRAETAIGPRLSNDQPLVQRVDEIHGAVFDIDAKIDQLAKEVREIKQKLPNQPQPKSP